jgi:hypothetical protein
MNEPFGDSFQGMRIITLEPPLSVLSLTNIETTCKKNLNRTL